jgi:two-component system OmpR family response regulator/two-component system response regulator RstA
MNKTVLIVEDDAVMALTLSAFLEKQGYSVVTHADGENIIGIINEHEPDAIILDVNLPGKDGFEICKEARTIFDDPIIMLTARDEDVDQIIGLELGADDYITKPTEPRLILARLKACLRRIDTITNTFTNRESIVFDIFSINKSTRTVLLDQQEIQLSAIDFDLLWLMASNAGDIITRDQIQKELRGIEHDGLDRSIDMRVSRLRKRLEDDIESPRRIKTVRGKGYLFNSSGWD